MSEVNSIRMLGGGGRRLSGTGFISSLSAMNTDASLDALDSSTEEGRELPEFLITRLSVCTELGGRSARERG